MATLPKTGRIAPGQLSGADVPQLRAPRDPGLRIPSLNMATGLAEGIGAVAEQAVDRFDKEDEALRKMDLARADADTQIKANALFNNLVQKNEPSTFQEELDKGLREIAETHIQQFGDDRTRSAYEIGFEQFRGNVLTKGQNAARTLRVQNGFTQTDDLLDVLQEEANKSLLTGDTETRQNTLQQIDHILSTAEQTGFFSPEQASAKREEVQVGMVRGRFEALLNNNPRSAEAFLMSDAASVLSMEERQKGISVAREALYTSVIRQQKQDDRARIENERLLNKRQSDNYTQLLVLANRGELDLESAEKQLLDGDISSAHFNSLANIDLQADVRGSQSRLLEYETAFQDLEGIGTETPNSEGRSKPELIAFLNSQIEADSSLTASDKMKGKVRLNSIQNNTDVMETFSFKEARRLMNMGFGDPRDLVEARIGGAEKQRALAANYEFSKRVFEGGEDPMIVATELLDREQNTFKSIKAPFTQSRLRIEMRGIPKEFHSFTAMNGTTIPSTANMKARIQQGVVEGAISKKDALQYAQHLDEIETIIGPLEEPIPEPIEPQGPEASSFIENSKTIANQVVQDVRQFLIDEGVIKKEAEQPITQPPVETAETEPNQAVEEPTTETPSEVGTSNVNPLEGGSPINKNIVKAINEASSENGINPDLVKALIAVESGFKPKATNDESTASGLFQLTEATRKEFGLEEKDRFNIKKNVSTGVKHLAALKKMVVDSGVTGETNQRALMIAGHRVGQTALREAIRSVKSSGKPMTVQNVIDAMPEDTREKAMDTMSKVGQMISRGNDG